MLKFQSDIPQALKSYESAIEKSNQREIQLLCLHEIGWCYLIQLDWGNAYHCFNQLKSRSKWSRSFYTYLTVICLGACNDVQNALTLAQEIPKLVEESSGSVQIETFISRRIRKFPITDSKVKNKGKIELVFDKLTCELFILELLYFWNALPSCDTSELYRIVEGRPVIPLCFLFIF